MSNTSVIPLYNPKGHSFSGWLGGKSQLARTIIDIMLEHNASYDYVLKRVDGPDTLFYLDPPYWDCENVYGKGIWSKQDFYDLKDYLDKIQGKFILSLNDTPV